MSTVFEALVDYHYHRLRGESAPKPRSEDGDTLEIARMEALARARAVDSIARRKLQEYHDAKGDGVRVVDPYAPTRSEYFGNKDAGAGGDFETRDGPVNG